MSKKEEPIQSALFELNKVDEAFTFTTPQQGVRQFEIPGTQILLGTSSFTAAGWEGTSYPQGMRSKDFLRHYSSQLQTVELLRTVTRRWMQYITRCFLQGKS